MIQYVTVCNYYLVHSKKVPDLKNSPVTYQSNSCMCYILLDSGHHNSEFNYFLEHSKGTISKTCPRDTIALLVNPVKLTTPIDARPFVVCN
jgi:hypothetical protein